MGYRILRRAAILGTLALGCTALLGALLEDLVPQRVCCNLRDGCSCLECIKTKY